MSDALDINEIARAAISRAGLERDTHIALRASLFDPPPRVSGSRERLVEAVGCLLERARQVVAGCAGAAIELETEPDGDRVAIRILDNGPGLAEEELERIFDPFQSGPLQSEPLAGGPFAVERLARGEPVAGRDSIEGSPRTARVEREQSVASAAARAPGADGAAVGKEARELADAFRIFRDHRGALLVRSRPGEGTCVIALLPALFPSPSSRHPRR